MGLNLNGLNKGRRTDDLDDPQREEAAFRTKVALQQFMNLNGPLFAALARTRATVNDVVGGDLLKLVASQAMRLAALVAAKTTGKDIKEVTAADLRPFRSAAASYVASCWQSNRPLNVERAAAEIVGALDLADKSWDHDPYLDDRMSNHASLMITAANAATTLASSVEKYDFRMGRAEVLSRLVAATAEAAARTAREMLGDNASDSDLRNVTQTAARNFASIMESCYERKARDVVNRLKSLPEEEKIAWYASHDPLGEVLAAFREWTLCLGGFAIAATREMAGRKDDLSSGSSPEPRRND